MTSAQPEPAPIDYPSSDGKRMAENTKQARWIVVLFGNLLSLYRDRADVFVAADNLWYPAKGERKICNAPGRLRRLRQAQGRPPPRTSDGANDVPLTVVAEVLSPSNSGEEMIGKHLWYEQYGVEEYYVYDQTLTPWRSQRAARRRLRRRPEHLRQPGTWASASTCRARRWSFTIPTASGS